MSSVFPDAIMRHQHNTTMSNKLNASQLTVLTTIKDAKKATKKAAVANGGNSGTLTKLVDLGLVSSNEATKKQPEVTFSVTVEGKAALKDVAKAEAVKAKAAAIAAKLQVTCPKL